MARVLLRKHTGLSNGVNSEARFRDMVRHDRSTRSASRKDDAVPAPAVSVTHFNLKRLGYTFYEEAFDVSFRGILMLSFIVTA